MKNMTTPQAILVGLSLIAIAIASLPFSNGVIEEAHADMPQKVMICNEENCAKVTSSGRLRTKVDYVKRM